MKFKSVFIMIPLLILGCNTSVTVNPSTSPSSTSTPSSMVSATPSPASSPASNLLSEVYANSDIQDDKIVSGNRYVFKYSNYIDPIPEAADDEYTTELIFAVDKSTVENFNLQNSSDFTASKAVLKRYCFCAPVSVTQQMVVSGQIKGTGSITSSTWNVEAINLKNSNNNELRFSSTTFMLKNP